MTTGHQHDDSIAVSRLFLAQFLPKALRLCTEHYRHCLAQPQGDIPKDIKEYHMAGKAAVAHIAALLKLIDQCAATTDNPHHATEKPFEEILALTRATLMNKNDHDTDQAAPPAQAEL